MKLLLAGVLGWTAALVPLLLFVPGYVNTPGCAHRIGISAACAAQMAAQDEELRSLVENGSLAAIAWSGGA